MSLKTLVSVSKFSLNLSPLKLVLDILPPVLFRINKSINFFVLFIRNFDQFSNILDVKFHLCPYLL